MLGRCVVARGNATHASACTPQPTPQQIIQPQGRVGGITPHTTPPSNILAADTKHAAMDPPHTLARGTGPHAGAAGRAGLARAGAVAGVYAVRRAAPRRAGGGVRRGRVVAVPVAAGSAPVRSWRKGVTRHPRALARPLQLGVQVPDSDQCATHHTHTDQTRAVSSTRGKTNTHDR